MDIPAHGKCTGIMLNRRRYRCQSCRKTFLEPVPHKDGKRQMTRRLIQYIERESLRRTFLGVADDVGVDEKAVLNIFNDYCECPPPTRGFPGDALLRVLMSSVSPAHTGMSRRINQNCRNRGGAPHSGRIRYPAIARVSRRIQADGLAT